MMDINRPLMIINVGYHVDLVIQPLSQLTYAAPERLS